MAEITITKDDDGRHGRYVARIAGIDDEAELTFTHRGPGLISAEHPVPDHPVLPICPRPVSQESGLAGRYDSRTGRCARACQLIVCLIAMRRRRGEIR